MFQKHRMYHKNNSPFLKKQGGILLFLRPTTGTGLPKGDRGACARVGLLLCADCRLAPARIASP